MKGAVMPSGPNETQKYEREIAEILDRMERDEPRTERVKRQARRSAGQRWQGMLRGADRLRRLDVGGRHAGAWTWIGLTLGVGIAGLFLRPLSPPLGAVCAVVMVLLFFSPLLRRVSSGPDPFSAPTWRGRATVDYYRPRAGLGATLSYYWRRLRYGRGRDRHF